MGNGAGFIYCPEQFAAIEILVWIADGMIKNGDEMLIWDRKVFVLYPVKMPDNPAMEVILKFAGSGWTAIRTVWRNIIILARTDI